MSRSASRTRRTRSAGEEARRPGVAGAPIAERIPFPWGVSASVEEASGTLTAAAPTVNLKLVDIDVGATLTAYAEATSGEPDSEGHPPRLRRQTARSQQPGRPSNLRRRFSTPVTEGAVGHTLDVRAAAAAGRDPDPG